MVAYRATETTFQGKKSGLSFQTAFLLRSNIYLWYWEVQMRVTPKAGKMKKKISKTKKKQTTKPN